MIKVFSDKYKSLLKEYYYIGAMPEYEHLSFKMIKFYKKLVYGQENVINLKKFFEKIR